MASGPLLEVGCEQGLEPSEQAFAQDDLQATAQMPAMQLGIGIDWLPVFASEARASDICALLPLRQMGALRGTSCHVLSAAQLAFDASWRRQFPCPWSAAAGGDPAEDEESTDQEEAQKNFSERINKLERAMTAMANGDAKGFGEAAEALGPRSLSMLNMASFGGNSNDRSLLHYAAIRCDLAAARWLLRRGASPNVKSLDIDCYGMSDTSWTPLHHAARNGDVAMCKLLLAAGADVHTKLTDPEDKSYDREFRSLLASGSCFYKDHFLGEGSTAADIATRIGNKPLAELLRTWPHGAPARARPPCLASAGRRDDRGNEINAMGAKVADAVAKAIMEDPRPVVLRPRHRHCKVPGPLVPAAHTTRG